MAVGAISGAASYQASSSMMTGATATTSATATPAVSAVSDAMTTEESSEKTAVKKQATEKKKQEKESNNDVLSMTASGQEMTEEKMQKAIDDINRNLQDKTCEFGYDDKTNRVTIKIVDKETDEVIRELPPEKTLKMIAKVWELAGLLVDEKL